jgi:hypothetical protein
MAINKLFILPLVLLVNLSFAQTAITLKEALRIATDSSLASFKAKNLYLADYWEYRTYISQLRPQVSLTSVPMDYNRVLIKRYNSILDVDEYREQQNIYAYTNLSLSQNLPITGGTLYFDSELGYLRNFSSGGISQFSTVPLRVGYNQRLFGYNSLKWKKKLEPLKYEKAKREYVQSIMSISEQCVDYYFNLIISRIAMQMAQTNKANADTLYAIGLKRFEIASLTQADVLTLRVDVLNAENEMAKAKKQFQKSQFEFNSFLRLPKSTNFDPIIPSDFPVVQVNPELALQLAEGNNPDIISCQEQLISARMEVDRTKCDNRFNANLNMSIGFNQQDSLLGRAYKNPLDQQRMMVSLTIPILDWGTHKGKLNMAKKNLEAISLSVEQKLVDLKQTIFLAVMDFNMQQSIVRTALESRDIAKQAYETTKQRFIIGKADVNSLSLALKRQDDANLNYLNALRGYWSYLFILQKLTLYDFEKGENIMDALDENLGVL